MTAPSGRLWPTTTTTTTRIRKIATVELKWVKGHFQAQFEFIPHLSHPNQATQPRKFPSSAARPIFSSKSSFSGGSPPPPKKQQKHITIILMCYEISWDQTTSLTSSELRSASRLLGARFSLETFKCMSSNRMMVCCFKISLDNFHPMCSTSRSISCNSLWRI